MSFRITITEAAESQRRSLPVRDQRVVEAAILAKLAHEPTAPSNAIKRLRPNSLAEFERGVGALRVLYNVVGDEVVLILVGRKVGNKLIVEGRAFHGHRSGPAEPTQNGPKNDAD